MPKSRKSYTKAELDGSVAVNKGRYAHRASAPPTTGTVGDPPAYFTPDQDECWHQVKMAIPAGVAGSSDVFAVEIAARLLHEFRTDPEMPAAKLTILTNTMSRLGLDAQGRTRLMLGPPPPDRGISALDRFNAAIEKAKRETVQ